MVSLTDKALGRRKKALEISEFYIFIRGIVTIQAKLKPLSNLEVNFE